MSTTRDATVDVARGLAIIAIVLGHVERGLIRADLLDGALPAIVELDRILYLVHLPVFAFLAGLFVARGVERDGVARYLRSRVVLFAWLYVLWSLLQGLVTVALSSLVNRPRSPIEVLELWVPKDQFWFLTWLIVATVIAVLIRPWRVGVRRWIGVAAAIGSLAFWGLGWNVVGGQGLALTAFYLAGCMIGAERVRRLVGRLGVVRALLVAVLLALVFVAVLAGTTTPPTEGGATRTPTSVALGVLAAVVGTGVVLSAARALSRLGPLTRVLALLGERSLEIFLAHILATAGARIVLDRLGIDEPALQVAGGVIAGLAFPLALWWLTTRLGAPWLFQAPRPLTGARR
ncbi:acyltransferase [Schumannella sp. 10F1B-5-1]|uniref:acyltransferase family protein n=1 Tax=Schumannella sp. 10F1B-5-1 TaxID=2590780 RepID=UPI0011312D91|nr:acyltransferase [Schumannella sp. 10F1B-5-1]TPW70802.1 acyltransferase [Schumannella sp. 10F1B-5-1]